MRFAQSGSEDTALRGDCPFAHLIELWQQLAQRPGDTGWAAVSASPLIKIFPITLFGLVHWPAIAPLTSLPHDQMVAAGLDIAAGEHVHLHNMKSDYIQTFTLEGGQTFSTKHDHH